MLDDRDYMRHARGRYLRSPVTILLITLVTIFLIECCVRVFARTSLALWFGLSLPAIADHQYWRLITYQFLHDAPWPWHILFNSIGLFFFGRALLEEIGARRFWQVYLGAGLVGGLVEIACQAWHPAYGAGLTVGASASVLGLAGTFCILFPGRDVVFFLYVFPVRLRAITLFWILLGFTIFGLLFLHGSVAHGAHLGGLLAGVGYVRLFLSDDALGWWRRMRPRRPARRTEVPVPAGRGFGHGHSIPPAEEADTAEDFMRREVDPILDKISAHGIQSLTERERRILERARERMRGR